MTKKQIELNDLPALKKAFLDQVHAGTEGLENFMCSFKFKDDVLIYLYPVLEWLDMESPIENLEMFNLYQP